MSNEVANKDSSVVEQVIAAGDISKLTPDQRVILYKQVCDSLGLNPLTRPFEFINLGGRLTFYARKDCTDQLRSIKNVSITIKSREQVGDIFIVTANAKFPGPGGREDEAIGALPVGGLKGDALAIAFMKAETKAKRRVTLSICGLGLLDESEIDLIPRGAEPTVADVKPAELPADEKPKTRTDIIVEIMSAAKELNCSQKELGEWAQDIFKKQTKELSDTELGSFLTTLQEEIGRKGDVA